MTSDSPPWRSGAEPDLTRLAYVRVRDKSLGTGYRVADNLVLTAAHVVAAALDAGSVAEVLLFQDTQWVSAQVVLTQPVDGLDMAVLEIGPETLPVPTTPAPTWGRIVGTSGVRVYAVCFSAAMKNFGSRDTHLIRGIVEPAHGATAFQRGKATLAIDMDSVVPARRQDRKSPWSGGSGAAVFAAHTGQLLGVLTDDVDISDSARVLHFSLVAELEELVGRFRPEIVPIHVASAGPNEPRSTSAGKVPVPLSATDPPPPPSRQTPTWAVARADELEQIVAAVCALPTSPVGITTGLKGAGGFGKTMLAELVCADERVRHHFAGRVYVVTIGRDVSGSAAIATKVAETIRFITGQITTYTDPAMAGDELGRLLDQHPDRRTLLVLDDVWEPAQLDPFLHGGKNCVRLVTTRVPEVLPDNAAQVRVDQMTAHQARSVLNQDLPPLPEHLAVDLTSATGKWPLLLRLVNRWIVHQMAAGADIELAASDVLTLLRKQGPAAIGHSHPPPNPADPSQRSRLVRATIQAATELLGSGEPQRLAELGIFAADEPIPVLVSAMLWQATARLDDLQSRLLCHKLSGLSLLTLTPNNGGALVLHGVIRDYLRHELGQDRLSALNNDLIGAINAALPPAAPLTPSQPHPQAAWWTLVKDQTPADCYLADHAVDHLLAAGRVEQAEALACDIRWVEARLLQRGPAAPWSDCTRIPTTVARQRARDLAQAAHLLAPTEPPHAQTAVLHSRLGPLPGWNDQVTARQSQLNYPVLRNHWPPPDLPHPALLRVLTGHGKQVTAVAIAPDGTWLATGAIWEGRVRIWDTTTGTQIAALNGPGCGARTLAISPDGDCLITIADFDQGRVRIWNPATGAPIAVLDCHIGLVNALAISPDGTWLAVNDDDHKHGKVLILDSTTGTQTSTLAGHVGRVTSLAISPDGTWLATGDHSGLVRIWDTATGTQTATFAGHVNPVWALAIAPDGTWLATAESDFRDEGRVRIWDIASATQTTHIYHRGHVNELAIAPDGTWLATVNGDGNLDSWVGIWDVTTGTQVATLKSSVTALAIAPDGNWLATGGVQGAVRIWDTASVLTATLAAHSSPVWALAIAPDGTWLATNGRKGKGEVQIWDMDAGVHNMLTGNVDILAIAPDGVRLVTSGYSSGTVEIWDPATGAHTATLISNAGWVRPLAIAPDGTWLATSDHSSRYSRSGSGKGIVRIWDTVTGVQTGVLTEDVGWVTALAIAPDGTWLVTAHLGGRMLIWNKATGTPIIALSEYGSAVEELAIAPDGTWLATAEYNQVNGTIRIWDATTGGQTASRIWHGREVTGLAISPNGTWLATLSAIGGQGEIQIWTKTLGQLLTTMRTDGKPHRCAWTPDGTSLAVGGHEGLYFYEFDPGTSRA